LIYNLRVQLVEKEILREKYLNKYKEKHPRVEEVERQIQVLKDQISAENERVVSGQKRAIEYEILRKGVRADQDLYNILIKKLKELDISGGGIESNIEIIEKAIRPTIPIAPRKKRNLSMGIILGLALGLGAIFVSAYFDPTLQTPGEVETFLNLPVLVSVPRMESPPGLGKTKSSDYFFRISERSPRSREAELFKRLRTNIRFSDFGASTISLLVTSPTPREGKSTVASNLSTTMAHAGSRTVLIDTDMRRPAVHHIFGLDNSVGLSSYLQGKAAVEDIIFPGRMDNISFIPSGPIPPNPSELLESARFAELIQRLKADFDRLVFDSPPAGALTDASIIGSLVDGVILVCFAGHVDKRFVLRTKQQLEKGGAKIFGVVLNYIELKLRSYHYYYTSVYKYGY
jgi:capsular exopolysaccharide synthesis family protein